MVIINISGELNSVLECIGGMCFKAESILNLCMDGFMKHKVDSIDEARKVSQTIRNEGNEVRKLLIDKAKEAVVNREWTKSMMSIIGSIEMAVTGLDSVLQHVNEVKKLLSDKAKEADINREWIKSMISIIGSIEMAVTGLDSVLQHVRVQITEGILFSDKAISEISFLFKETLDIVKTAGGALVTKNEVFMKYVVDKYKNLDGIVSGYEEKHEYRLIKGTCQAQASQVYSNILDAIMTVGWHTKQALLKLFEAD